MAMRSFAQLRKRVAKLGEQLSFVPPLLVRLVLFALFAPTGWGKLHHLGKVTAYFTELQLPAPHFMAGLVGTTELVGGTLLLLGLLARWASIPLIISMTVAIVTAKGDQLSGVLDLLTLDELVYIVLLIAILIGGPGRVSLDALLHRWRKRASRAGATSGRAPMPTSPQ